MTDAFADHPAKRYIFPDAVDRARRLPRLYDSSGLAGMRLLTSEGEAASPWRAPGRARIGWGEMLRYLPGLPHALGGNSARALRICDAISAHMPDSAFWYLPIAGCDFAIEDRGLARPPCAPA